MKKLLALTFLYTCSALAGAQASGKLTAFDLQDIRLLDGPFKAAEQVDMDYILEMDMDRLLAPFLHEAGLEPKAESYANWENTGLDGHIGGHYLSALALMVASTGDERMKERLDYMVGELKRAQQQNGNGYVGGVPGGKAMWKEIKDGNIRAGSFSLNDRWVPLYNIHKTYAGLRDAYWLAGNEDAKEMLIELTDWMLDVVAGLSNEQIQDMLRSEYGGLNETFADVAEITGEEKYLKLARQFSQQSLLDPLIRHEGRLTGMHANTQIPKVVGFKRIADLENEETWDKACRFFWENVTEKRSVSIGGNSVREHFHPIDDYSPMINSEQGPETCNTYNMLKLSKMLFLSDPQSRYLEFYERALYNHILSTQHPEKGGFVYFTPMRPGHYRVYSQPHECFWCCVGSGLENHAKYGELIYAHAGDELYVNLFIASVVRWKEKGVMLTQQSRFPDESRTSFELKTDEPIHFTLKLRCPDWVTDDGFKVKVNGEVIDVEICDYVAIERMWKNGDTIEMELPMQVIAEQLPDHSNYYSFRCGPVVLATKTTDREMPGLFGDDSRGGHIAEGRRFPLNEMPMLIGDPAELVGNIKPVAGKPLTFNMGEQELMPFFRLHDSRYIVYWRNESAENIEAMQVEMAAREAAEQKLAAATIDLVYPGEQQPESDHFIKSNRSKIGVHRGRHWRDAFGWFSYEMRDAERRAKKLRVTYFGGDRNRDFKILVNDTVIADVRLDGSHGDEFFNVEYPVPAKVADSANGVFSVKFEAEPGSVAGGIYEVRLMK